MEWESIQFDWNRARAFLVTAEEGSLSAAARALKTTQPTLGRQVAALEEELGVVLFERTSSGLLLTSNGTELLESIRKMGTAASQFSLAAMGRTQAIEGEVCISATEVTAAYELPHVLKKLRQQEPSICVKVIASNDSSDLIRREADIAIRSYRPKELDLISRKIDDGEAHLYASSTYLKTLKKRESPTDFIDAKFIGFEQNDEFCAELMRQGFAVGEHNFAMHVKSHLVQWQMVKQGLGIAPMIATVGDREPGVERIMPNFPAYEYESWLVVHRELHTSRRIRLVFDFLAAELANN